MSVGFHSFSSVFSFTAENEKCFSVGLTSQRGVGLGLEVQSLGLGLEHYAWSWSWS